MTVLSPSDPRASSYLCAPFDPCATLGPRSADITRAELAVFAQIVDRLTRRGFLAGAGATALGLGLAACGSSPAPAPPAAAAQGGVDTLYGLIPVPAEPKRIVAVNFPEAMTLLDLGIVPVGLPSYLPPLPAYDAYADLPRVDPSNEIDIELVAGLRPDLIVGSDFAGDRRVPYDKLSRIAPTALFEWKAAAGNWPNEAELTARAVGQSAQLTALATSYHDRASAIRAKYAQVLAATRWDLISGSSTGVWDLYGPESSHGRVVAEAGLRFAAGEGQTENYVEYSEERLDLINNSQALLVQADPDTGVSPIAGRPGYENLPAVRAGNAFLSKSFFPAGYRAAIALLDDLDTALAGYRESTS